MLVSCNGFPFFSSTTLPEIVLWEKKYVVTTKHKNDCGFIIIGFMKQNVSEKD
jgi:hypothetical protein